MNYRAPWWLPGGNLQTIWPALPARRFVGEHPVYRRERWVTPDDDFVDLDWLEDVAPTLDTACAALPPEGAFAPWGGPAALTPYFRWRRLGASKVPRHCLAPHQQGYSALSLGV
jgi:predicted alpha/beta-fold hydrolase